MGVIKFNGITSRDIGLEVETFPAYNIPEKEYQVYHVLGRNGDIVLDTGTYKNVNRSYRVSIATWNQVSYSKKMSQVAEWLYSGNGYSRLEDSYDEDFYRMAYYNEQISIENLFNEAGRATINFICKPQRYYKSGELPVTFLETGTIQNNTRFKASPLLKITHSAEGFVSIGTYTIGITLDAAPTIYIDCERQDAYSYDTTTFPSTVVNENPNIVLLDGDFPKIEPGLNNIILQTGITSIEITPRWWTI